MRMSDAEAIMWAVEKDPALRSDFTNISILERAPDAARVRAKVEQAIEAIPRLGDRVVAPPFRLATPEWVPDHDLDLGYHLRTVAVPAPGGMRQLLDLAAAVAATPLDRSRPLWEFTIVEGLEGGRAAFLQKVHHTITDGVGGVKLSLSLLDFEPDPPAPPEPSPMQRIAAEAEAERRAAAFADPVKRVSPATAVEKAVAYTLRQQFGRARRSLESATHVLASPESARRGVNDAVRLAGSVRRQLLVTDPARSPLLGRRSLALRFERFGVPLSQAKATGAKLGGSINDVYVTGITGALGLYHERMGVPCDELRMAMPISTRGSDEESANSFTPARVLVPVTPKDPAARFKRRARTTARSERRAGGHRRRVAGGRAHRPTDLDAGRAHSHPSPHDRLRNIEPAGQPGRLVPRGRPHRSQLPDGPARGVRAERHAAELPRLARYGGQHRSRRRERSGDADRLFRRVVRRAARR